MTTLNSIVFSGHRNVQIEHSDLIGSAVENACQRASDVFFGGAAGFDTLALLWVCHLVRFEKWTPPHVWLVVPAKLENQPTLCEFAVEQALQYFPDKFTLVEMGQSYNGESLKGRNREMIDRAIARGNPELVCYFDGTFKSGTYSAMCYAKKKGVPVTNIIT